MSGHLTVAERNVRRLQRMVQNRAEKLGRWAGDLPQDVGRQYAEARARWDLRRSLGAGLDPDAYAYAEMRSAIEEEFQNLGHGAGVASPRLVPGAPRWTVINASGWERPDSEPADGPRHVQEVFERENRQVGGDNADEPDLGEATVEREWARYIAERDRLLLPPSPGDAALPVAFVTGLWDTLTSEEWKTWEWRGTYSLTDIARLEGLSRMAVHYREKPVVEKAIAVWQRLYGPDLPGFLRRRPTRHGKK